MTPINPAHSASAVTLGSLVLPLALFVTILQPPWSAQRAPAEATAYARTVLASLAQQEPSEYQTAGHVAEEVVAEIAAFIKR
jgi:hypothetical protein